MSEHSLARTGALPLSFSGHLLGAGKIGHKFWTKVLLYRTDGGTYVAHVLHGSYHEDNQGESKVTVCEDVPALVEALKDRAGKLGGASVQALAEAAQSDPGIRALASERVE